MTQETIPRRRTMAIVTIYPFGVLLVGVALNLFVFGVVPAAVALPSVETIYALTIAGVLLIINHTWLMTTTELTRVRYNMFASPEEWSASGISPDDAPREGLRQLERRHNTHRNTTENTIYFIFLALIFVLVSPTSLAALVWIIGFPIARLGYTYSYISGRVSARGLMMSLSLLAIYGMASYLVISLFL